MKPEIPIVACILFGLMLVVTLATEDRRIKARIIGVTAICEDGMFTTAPKQGACRGHGGVKKWLD